MNFAAQKLHFFSACSAAGRDRGARGESVNMPVMLMCPRRIGVSDCRCASAAAGGVGRWTGGALWAYVRMVHGARSCAAGSSRTYPPLVPSPPPPSSSCSPLILRALCSSSSRRLAPRRPPHAVLYPCLYLRVGLSPRAYSLRFFCVACPTRSCVVIPIHIMSLLCPPRGALPGLLHNSRRLSSFRAQVCKPQAAGASSKNAGE